MNQVLENIITRRSVRSYRKEQIKLEELEIGRASCRERV